MCALGRLPGELDTPIYAVYLALCGEVVSVVSSELGHSNEWAKVRPRKMVQAQDQTSRSMAAMSQSSVRSITPYRLSGSANPRRTWLDDASGFLA